MSEDFSVIDNLTFDRLFSKLYGQTELEPRDYVMPKSELEVHCC